MEENDESLDSVDDEPVRTNGGEFSDNKAPCRRSDDSDSDTLSLGGRSRVRKNFWSCYVNAVHHYLGDMKKQIDVSSFQFLKLI